jgi:hypothetical protein
MDIDLSAFKELLKTKKQVKYIMARDPNCLCIEAVIALSCGATIEKKQNNKHFVHFQGIALEGEIEEDLFPSNVPRFIYKEDLLNNFLKLNLSIEQTKKIKEQQRSDYTWNFLNDVIGLDFRQFQILMDIVLVDN